MIIKTDSSSIYKEVILLGYSKTDILQKCQVAFDDNQLRKEFT